MSRQVWHQLPETVRRAVEAVTGPIMRADEVAAGSVADLVTVVHTAGERTFVKGARHDSGAAAVQRKEARLNPWLPLQHVPRLHATIDQDGWVLHLYQHVDGRHADLAPDSADLKPVSEVLAGLEVALTPSPPVPVPVQRFADRWAGRIPAHLVDGTTLVHTDMTPRNFLVCGDRAWLVDWAGPCIGAPWISTAFLVVRLIRAGHAPVDAEAFAGRVPSWSTASPGALDAFAEGSAHLWALRLKTVSSAHHAPLAAAAHAWHTYRTAM